MTSQAQAFPGTPPTAPVGRPAPKRPIDQAAALGVSEATWLTAHQTDAGVTRLSLPAADILMALPALGPVMALTRNPSCVHEKDGAYANIEISGAMGLVLNHDIDLRLFLGHWAHGFSVEAPLDGGGIRHSLQFFDSAGVAVHKIFARPATDIAAWRALVARFAAGPLQPVVAVPPGPAKADSPDSAIDLEALRAGWSKLADVHDFFALLRRQGVGRRQALRLAGDPFARRIAPASVRWILDEAAAREVPIMCFVGNPGCIQIHSGPIRKVVEMGPWLNVLDPGFNLHLRADHVADAFAVWKPQTDSAVHSIELFDAEGQLICQLFGERKPGRPELEGWKQLVAEVSTA
jgi:putative hemin transport protein